MTKPNNNVRTTTAEIFRLTQGERIRKARQHAALEPDELGAKVGVSAKTITRWERDHGEPRISDAKRIAAATGVDFIDLCAPWELNPQPADYRAGAGELAERRAGAASRRAA